MANSKTKTTSKKTNTKARGSNKKQNAPQLTSTKKVETKAEVIKTSTPETNTENKLAPLPREKSLVVIEEMKELVPVETTETEQEAITDVLETSATVDAEKVKEVTEKAAEEVSALSKPDVEETEEAADEKSKEATETQVIFGCDVSHIGLEYPSTHNRAAISFRKEVSKLEQMLYKMSDDSLVAVAENIQAGLNRLEARIDNRRCNTRVML